MMHLQRRLLDALEEKDRAIAELRRALRATAADTTLRAPSQEQEAAGAEGKEDEISGRAKALVCHSQEPSETGEKR